MTTTSGIYEEIADLKTELLKIKEIIITEERLIQILRDELGHQENKYKNGIEKIQKQIIQMRINNNPGKSLGLDFSDFQPPPSLPWGKPFENNKEKDKRKQIIYNEN